MTPLKPYYRDEVVTIYHGDAREIAPAAGLVDMIFTDPPYGHNNNENDLIGQREAALGRFSTKARGRESVGPARPMSSDSPEEAAALARWLFEYAPTFLRSGGCCCCCCSAGGGPDPQFARWSLWMDEHLEFKQMIIWDKGPMGMGWHYRRSHEVVLVAQKRGGKCKWYDETNKVENIIRWPRIKKIIPSKTQHPTEKPAALAAFFIELHSQPGETILDPFMGAGSTLRAAKDLGRKAIGIEVEEHWCAQAARRLSQTTLGLSL